MDQDLFVKIIIAVSLGILFAVFPEKAARIRDKTPRNSTPPEDLVSMMRLFGIILALIATFVGLAAMQA